MPLFVLYYGQISIFNNLINIDGYWILVCLTNIGIRGFPMIWKKVLNEKNLFAFKMYVLKVMTLI